MRRFSSYGPIDTEEHYYAPRQTLIEKAYSQLVGENPVKGGHYFTVWAPRQTGKTWLMQEVAAQIKRSGNFDAGIITIERAKEEEEERAVLDVLIEKMQNAFSVSLPPLKRIKEIPSILTRKYFKNPVILILDEFDALEEKFINAFASVFREMFISRSNERDKSTGDKSCLLHSIALIGVRSVLGIENVSGSPFNVQRSLHIPDLTGEEVKGMFDWYQNESGQKIEPEVVERLFYETCGQPGLICWFGELLTDTYNTQPTAPITMEHFKYVYKEATNVLPNNNILNIISKAKQDSYKGTVLELFKTDKKVEFRFDDKDLNFLYMNGVTDIERETDEKGESQVYCKFASPFVQNRLFNYFAGEIFGRLGPLVHPLDKMEDAVSADSLNIPNIIKRYKTYLGKNRDADFHDVPRRKTDKRIYEAVYHFNLFRYLYDLLSKRGVSVIPEFPTGNGKIDLMLKYRENVYAIELKSFKDMYDYRRGVEQAAGYGKRMGLKEIILTIFVELKEEEVTELEQEIEQDGINVIVIPIGVS